MIIDQKPENCQKLCVIYGQDLASNYREFDFELEISMSVKTPRSYVHDAKPGAVKLAWTISALAHRGESKNNSRFYLVAYL